MLSRYQRECLAAIFTCFGRESFVAWDLADLLDSPYGNACSTIRGLVKSGHIVETDPKQYAISNNVKIRG